MMAELRWAKKRYKIRNIDFEDDIFTVNKKWMRDFLTQYKRDIDIPFQALTHPKYIDATKELRLIDKHKKKSVRKMIHELIGSF